MSEVAIVIISAITGALASLLVEMYRTRTQLDETLRKDRMEAYKVLWGITGKLPLYPPEPNLPYVSLLRISKAMREWYFNVGGIYLSAETRDVYFSVQKFLIDYSQKQGILFPYTDETSQKYNEASDYEKVRRKLSDLRTQLTKDIDSRRAPGAPMYEESTYTRV
jgi:hypothetical protein